MRIRDEDEAIVQVEFIAAPRRRVCVVCLGSGTRDAHDCETCKGHGLILPPYPPFEREKITPIGNFKTAPFMVTIEDQPYCGFGNFEDASAAVKRWMGALDGLDRIVDVDHGIQWAAIEGRVVRIVRRTTVS